MDAQHDLVWLKTNVSYVIIKYSVYEIYKYMYLWHTIIFVIIQETVYIRFIFYTNYFFYSNVISLHWWMAYAYMDITYDDVCTCVYQSIGINRIPMNYKAFGFFSYQIEHFYILLCAIVYWINVVVIFIFICFWFWTKTFLNVNVRDIHRGKLTTLV